MPAKNKTLHSIINLDLLKPQSNPEKLLTRFFRWLLSTGRYILIFVEGLVLVAFLFRFKLDADIADTVAKIEDQKPYLKSLRPFEILVKENQLKLSTIEGFFSSNPDYAQILQKISAQIPLSTTLTSLSFEKTVDKISIRINGDAQNNLDLAAFQTSLKGDSFFSNVNLSSIGLEEGIIHFTIQATSSISPTGASL